jgi:prepilin-type N-terminal cleavage/methylation domain-containing protein
MRSTENSFKERKIMKMNKKLKKGFTLVELVVVIAVIAILAAVSVGAYFGVTDSANQSRCDQEAKAFHTALMLIANDPNDEGASWKTESNVTSLDVEDSKIEASIEKQLGYKVDVTTTVDGTLETDSEYKAEVKFEGATFTYGVSGKTTKIDIKTGSKLA